MSRLEDAIAAAEADRALDGLRCFDHLVLAVSGGPDSLALLYLTAEWVKRRDGDAPKITVATVDHGLRAQSALEARDVGEHATRLGLSHATLVWASPKAMHGIPNAARNARYALLEAHAVALSGEARVAVVTAHHQDDQAETLFMRLARGGGAAALGAMSDDRSLSETTSVRLVRPLLSFAKPQLMATLAARNIAWVDDPTNVDTAFERTRVRAALNASGLSSAALAQTAQRMREASRGLAYAADAFKQTLHLVQPEGLFVRFDRQAFEAGPAILRQMVVRELISTFGGETPAPGLTEIETLAKGMSDGRELRVTLGGAVISAGARYVRIWREPGRIAMAPVHLQPGQPQVWDDRFWIGFSGGADASINVAPLGRDRYEALRPTLPCAATPDDLRLPAGAAHGLPTFLSGAQVIAVPQLGYRADADANGLALEFSCEPIQRRKQYNIY